MEVTDLNRDSKFQFECGPHLACFKECCRRLRLVLTPYDCLKLKGYLGLHSDDFLERYCDLIYEDGIFPLYYLRMAEDGVCPFLGEEGCKVYPARPSACRLYPVGLGTTFVKGEREVYFLLRENHCLGHKEERLWTVREWMAHEGVLEYDRANMPWVQIVTSGEKIRKENFEKKVKMFLMASYNLDRFREFVFNTRFLELFHIGEERRQRLLKDDAALFGLAMDYLKFSLLGEPTLKVSKGSS